MIVSPMVQHTEQVLEWPVLIDCLAKEAASTMGAACCRALAFASDLQAARIQQQETTEMVHILEGPHPLPSLVFPDIRNVLARAQKEGILEGPDLRDISFGLRPWAYDQTILADSWLHVPEDQNSFLEPSRSDVDQAND